MNLKKKEIILIKHGISESVLIRMTEGQINNLYRKLVESKNESNEETKVVTTQFDKDNPQDMSKLNSMLKNPASLQNQNVEVKETEDLEEKAVSKKQQEFFGVVRAMQKGKLPKKGKAGKAAKEMSKKDVKDFASTKHKGLPIQANEGDESPLLTLAKQKMANNYLNAVNTEKPKVVSFGENELEKKITNLVEKHLHPSMTKNDLIKTIKNIVVESPVIEEVDEEITENQLPDWLQWNSIKQNKK